MQLCADEDTGLGLDAEDMTYVEVSIEHEVKKLGDEMGRLAQLRQGEWKRGCAEAFAIHGWKDDKR